MNKKFLGLFFVALSLASCAMPAAYLPDLDVIKFFAAASNYREVKELERLIQKGVNVNTVYHGNTALGKASSQGFIEHVRILLAAGAHVNTASTHGYTPLHYACCHNRVDCVNALLDAGADINATRDNDVTPFHEACYNGHLNCVNILVAKKANINAVNIWDETPLHYACLQNHGSCVQALIAARAKVNLPGLEEKTPLYIASQNGYLDIVKILVEEADADISAEDIMGFTPVTIAEFEGNQNIVEYFAHYEAPPDIKESDETTDRKRSRDDEQDGPAPKRTKTKE